MPPHNIAAQQLETQHAARALATLTLAFGTDPMTRWSWAASDVYLETFPIFVRAFAGPAYRERSVYGAGDLRAAAVWLPPGIEPDESQFIELMKRADKTRSKATESLFKQMESSHPKEPHWYLPIVGVDPMAQGQGLGSRVLQPVLAKCDESRTPAYLESSNPRNIPLYQRLGFEITGELQAGDSPTLTAMIRRPA